MSSRDTMTPKRTVSSPSATATSRQPPVVTPTRHVSSAHSVTSSDETRDRMTSSSRHRRDCLRQRPLSFAAESRKVRKVEYLYSMAIGLHRCCRLNTINQDAFRSDELTKKSWLTYSFQYDITKLPFDVIVGPFEYSTATRFHG